MDTNPQLINSDGLRRGDNTRFFFKNIFFNNFIYSLFLSKIRWRKPPDATFTPFGRISVGMAPLGSATLFPRSGTVACRLMDCVTQFDSSLIHLGFSNSITPYATAGYAQISGLTGCRTLLIDTLIVLGFSNSVTAYDTAGYVERTGLTGCRTLLIDTLGSATELNPTPLIAMQKAEVCRVAQPY